MPDSTSRCLSYKKTAPKSERFSYLFQNFAPLRLRGLRLFEPFYYTYLDITTDIVFVVMLPDSIIQGLSSAVQLLSRAKMLIYRNHNHQIAVIIYMCERRI